MPFGKDVPQIAITQEPEDDDDDENYEGAPIAESVTDTEDLEEGTSVRSTRSSTLKIKLNSDDCTTDVEDLEASDENPEDDDTDGEVELEGDAIEEEDVENDVRVINAKGEKKTQQSTRQHTGTASKAFKIFEGYTDEELFETDNEMEPEETPDNHFNMNYDTGVTDVTESSNLEKKSSKTKGSNKNYLSTISLTPNLSDLTDVEIINSDDESDSPKKTKTKRRRRRSFYGKSVTDVEDLEMSDDESKPKPHAKKTQSKHTKVKYTSLNFDSDNEENFSFPITKRVAKKEAILNVPEFNTNFLTDTEDFVSLIGSDTGYPDKDSSSDTEFVKKMDELAECYSQTRSSQKVYATDLDDTDVICLSENRPPLVEATDDSKCPTDVEEFDEDGDESASYPDIELPPPVNNMMIFSEKGTFPTVRIVPIPYKDEDSQESSEVAGISTGEESVSDFEEESAADDSVSLPNTDWGVVSIRDESVDKKNLPPDTDVSIQKRRKPPKFKHIYESELNHKNRLRAAMNGEADSKTDTEELFIDKARSGKTETSTDEDCSSQSRTCTPALLREQNESEVEPASVDVMYLKGGGYFPEILDAKSQSFTVLLQHYKEYCRLGDICNCVKEVGSPKEELSTNNKAGVAEEKGTVEVSTTKAMDQAPPPPIKAEGEEAADPGTSETKSEEKQHPF